MNILIESRVPLRQITRISPLNPRQGEDDVAEIAATIAARGLIEPLIVRPQPEQKPDAGVTVAVDYEVLAGGRRWRALRSLGDLDRPVEVRIHTGPDAEALELATIEAVTPRPHHPVEEHDAFRRMAEAGKSEEEIAAIFGASVLQVRQRLALSRLAHCVREAWRAGALTREQAEAFAAGDIAAQEALHQKEGEQLVNWRARDIRRALRSEALPEDSQLARFLSETPERVDMYRAAGGRIVQTLLDPAPVFLDARAAVIAADRLLMAEALRVMDAEGWGAAFIASADGSGDSDDYPDAMELDLIAEERERLEEIETALKPQLLGKTVEGAAELMAEADTLRTRGLLRTIGAEARWGLAVRAEIDDLGQLAIIRAVAKGPTPVAPPRPEPTEPPAKAKGEKPAKPPKPDKAEKPAAREPLPPAPSKEAGEYITEALENALKALVAQNANVALALIVAALGSTPHQKEKGVTIANSFALPSGHPPRAELLQAIEGERFEIALARCAAAPLPDFTVAFQELIARSVWLHDPPEPLFGALLTFAAPLGGNMAARLRDALDYERYMLALPREDILAVIRELEGEASAAECGKWQKKTLAPRAARTARDKGWLPERLLAPLQAIGAETGASAAEPEEESWPNRVRRIIGQGWDMPILADFLVATFRPSGHMLTVPRADFRSAFRAFAKRADPGLALPDNAPLAAALAAIGVTEEKEGASSLAARKPVYYSGIDWKEGAQ
ncbi:ParB/RepB/Spo0J family partition protein [Methylosinus sp. LW4]|uniref:ParB/RepB/Spo0J family partition protein n=1 Tax=Methylosinus sp. LW4 TaxID=136993 RepID=UPI00036812FA|nr:ParB N-terminal domain-containing protein [Methylosinus sp. LW4]